MANAMRTLVCVTVQKTCESLIREGAALAAGGPLSVVHVAATGAALLGQGNDGEALDYLFRIARSFGAEMDMLRADDVVGTLADFAVRHGVECIVLGAAGKGAGRSLADALRARLPGVRVHVVPR